MKNIVKSLFLLALGLSYCPDINSYWCLPICELSSWFIVSKTCTNEKSNLSPQDMSCLQSAGGTSDQRIIEVGFDWITGNVIGNRYGLHGTPFFIIKLQKEVEIRVLSDLIQEKWAINNSELFKAQPNMVYDHSKAADLCSFDIPHNQLLEIEKPLPFVKVKKYQEAYDHYYEAYPVDTLSSDAMSEFEDLLHCMSTLKILPRFDLQINTIDLDEFDQALPNLIEIIADLDPIQHELDANSLYVVTEILSQLFYRLKSNLFFDHSPFALGNKIAEFKRLYQNDYKILLEVMKKPYTCFNKDLVSVTFNGHTAHLGINLFRILHSLDDDLKKQLPAKLLFTAIDSVTSSPEASSISSPKELEQRILDKYIQYIKGYPTMSANVDLSQMD